MTEPTFPEITIREIAGMLGRLEKRLEAPVGSVVSLAFADDWSCVIRGHALVEGAVTVMLSDVLDERLRVTFAKLELGREDTGKLAFAKALDLLGADGRRFVRMLSTLRNVLAHDMHHLNFTFAGHVAAFDKQQRAKWVSDLSYPADMTNTTLSGSGAVIPGVR